ncbi:MULTISPECIES: Fpg/Nei family DNA glycosylase [Streptomycetaceae]|uniref:DNA-(Apurinic or apyrimidinic site) lyase n=1 Tax=Streptantibioticus cattleyicolor (strain ATCC 35852 / DSM 46488 / JCM 4925 / NBRC 14057 / NRRL 8057) TaxID=1003195 RepID=F8JNQ6_STREN|nr:MULTISPECIES: DNA-formamidopyrimidine glycosylase family protein [Streptomycetaceae]AEW92636.1 DNA-(apurinic or apyrimidinic site) lyase [Streptantibioticus cattleyicolor NRRL 8057 = DSM 46488]MYS57414.1 Fpg/Nei family DNA glycosylase [Streptomyces sp. SID5468]CCB72991.1 DNA-(Apurinic or apyrimidinic site) lyase; Formamidopyrimidine-DNA glycosylase [Streptantibioticus cattleyicolor NRRL 8057 = DSM 46488]
MPELPEIEALAGFLTGKLDGHTVSRIYPVAVSALKTYDPPLTALHGRILGPVRRHGKFLDITAGDLHLVVHLARAGWVRWREGLPTTPPKMGKGPLALRLLLADPPGCGLDLTEAGTQRRLAVHCVTDPREVPGIASLGVDPFDPAFTLDALTGLLRGERRRIKGVLRDQSVIAGIGNAYSDEVLHAARLSPYKLAADLTGEETARLHQAVTGTLTEAVERSRGLVAGDLKAEKKRTMRVHGRTGQPCPACGDTIREVSFADSSLQYCPTCQTGGRPLADRRLSRLLK